MKHETVIRIIDGGQLNPPVVTVGMHAGDFCLPNAVIRGDFPMVERREPGVCRDGNRVKRGRMSVHGAFLWTHENHKSYQLIVLHNPNNPPGSECAGALIENLLLLTV
jgi:hypothetical protein